MKRFFALAALSATLAVAAAPVRAVEIDIASTFPKDMLFLGDGLKQFAKYAGEISNGDIKINIHGAGELLPALEVLNAVSTGAVSGGYDWVGYWGGTIPVSNLIGALPFGPTPDVLAEWIWDSGGMEIVQKAYDAHQIKFLPCAMVPPEPAGWFRKEIKTADDLKGLRFRIGGLAGRALDKIGAVPQIVPGGEVYVALERGRIDAAEFSLPSIDETIQLQKAASYYYFPGWHQPSSILSVMLNKKVWDGLSKLQQNQVMTACRASFQWSMTNGTQDQIAALQRLEKGGTKIMRLPDPVLAALSKATDEVVAEERAKDAIFNEAFESLSKHMENNARWRDLQRMTFEKTGG